MQNWELEQELARLRARVDRLEATMRGIVSPSEAPTLIPPEEIPRPPRVPEELKMMGLRVPPKQK